MCDEKLDTCFRRANRSTNRPRLLSERALLVDSFPFHPGLRKETCLYIGDLSEFTWGYQLPHDLLRLFTNALILFRKHDPFLLASRSLTNIMLLSVLLSALFSSAYALPHGKPLLAARDHENAPVERGFFGDDQQKCTGDSLLTQELAYGGLFGGTRDPRVNYINSHNDEVQSVPFVSD